MKVVGIDSSLNGTGLARYTDERCVATHRIATKLLGHPRLERVLNEIEAFLRADRVDLVVIEGLSYGSFDTDRVLAGLWWHITHLCWKLGIGYAVIAPTSVKLYATAKGNAGKRLVYDTVNGPDFPTARVLSHDEADAVVLASIGCRWLGLPVDRVPDERWQHLLEVGSRWPDAVPA